MKKAGIAELKNRLSYYLGFVRRGQSVLVYDRDRVIARIEPVRASDALDKKDWTSELQQTGILRPPGTRLGKDWLRHRPAIDADVVAVLLAERESGW
jgi:antitoxin (DNA-binding transcriptional repressor) of toxin-antitoxin stability system